MAIPKAPVNRIIKDAGAERVSDAAVVALVEYLDTLTYLLNIFK